MIVIKFDNTNTISDGNTEDINVFVGELPWRLPRDAKLYSFNSPNLRFIEAENPFGGGGEFNVELLIVAELSIPVIKAVITAIYQSINKYLERDASRELTIEKDGRKITIKGHSILEQSELLEMLYPEMFLDEVVDSNLSRIERLSHDIDGEVRFIGEDSNQED